MADIIPLHGVKPERTGWRDESLSRRHRHWGFDCPGNDLDWIEYDRGEPVALFEYKNEFAESLMLSNELKSRRPLSVFKRLADRANLPAFICRYASDFAAFKVAPLNAESKKQLPDRATMSEIEYVRFLYRLRGRKLPRKVEEFLSGQIPLEF